MSAQRKFARPLSVEDTRRILQLYLSWEVVINTPQSVLGALDLAGRYRIPFWDALILHAAEYSGANVLYSEDFTNGRVYGSVQVVNPLLDSFELREMV